MNIFTLKKSQSKSWYYQDNSLHSRLEPNLSGLFLFFYFFTKLQPCSISQYHSQPYQLLQWQLVDPPLPGTIDTFTLIYSYTVFCSICVACGMGKNYRLFYCGHIHSISFFVILEPFLALPPKPCVFVSLFVLHRIVKS